MSAGAKGEGTTLVGAVVAILGVVSMFYGALDTKQRQDRSEELWRAKDQHERDLRTGRATPMPSFQTDWEKLRRDAEQKRLEEAQRRSFLEQPEAPGRR